MNILHKGDFAEKHLLRFIKQEIDALNVRTAIKFCGREGRTENLCKRAFIGGGIEVDETKFRELLQSKDIKRLRQSVESMDQFDNFPEVITGIDSAVMLDRVIEKMRIKQAGRFSSRYPLSVLPIIHYIIMKEREVENLRILARGKERGLPTATISELMVM